MNRMLTFVVLSAVCLVTLCVGGVHAQGFSAGARIWYANWEIEFEGESADLGDAPLILGYFGYHGANYSLIGQIGGGSGWDDQDFDVDRTDGSLALVLHENNISYGFAGHMITYSTSADEDVTYVGPEFLLGGNVPLDADGVWNVTASGTVGYYYWDYDFGARSDSGSVPGFTLDGGVSTSVESLNLRTGYRYQKVDEDSDFPGDEFSGLYVEAGFHW